jgi:lipopolysaccharide export LptBFGC system permease protein LptF
VVKRLLLSLAALAFGVALVAPAPAFARMHFTTTNERLDALATRANSSVNLSNPADIATQLNEITTQAQAAKAAAEEAAQRPASGAEDKSVLAKVGTDMDAVIAAANRAKTATGADQQNALKEIQTKSQESSAALKARIQAQLAAPAASPAAAAAAQPAPSVLPSSGQANVLGAAPSLLALGLVFVVGGLGILGFARLRRSA